MIFLNKEQIFVIHQTTLLEQGGTQGLRDENGLFSALNAAQNRANYEDAGIVICAATYAYHLIKAHAFVDGNKRVGAIAAEVFLLINGVKLIATNLLLEEIYLGVADNKISREDLEQFFQVNVEFL